MTEDPKAVDVNNTNTENYSLSRLHYIASTKQRIAEEI